MHDWTDTREYDLEERKRSKGEKAFLMTSVRDLMTQEGAAERRSLFHSIYDGMNFSACIEHFCQDAKRC